MKCNAAGTSKAKRRSIPRNSGFTRIDRLRQSNHSQVFSLIERSRKTIGITDEFPLTQVVGHVCFHGHLKAEYVCESTVWRPTNGAQSVIGWKHEMCNQRDAVHFASISETNTASKIGVSDFIYVVINVRKTFTTGWKLTYPVERIIISNQFCSVPIIGSGIRVK